VPFVVAAKRALALDNFAGFRAWAPPSTAADLWQRRRRLASHLACPCSMPRWAQRSTPYRGVAPAMNDLSPARSTV
jgi:hypothetical protein